MKFNLRCVKFIRDIKKFCVDLPVKTAFHIGLSAFMEKHTKAVFNRLSYCKFANSLSL